MSYAAVYAASLDETFQGRCLAAAWQTAQHVLVGTEGYDLTAPSKDFAHSLLRDQSRISAKQVAMQVLRNTTIAADVAASTDGDIDWQVKAVWADLVSIG
jgi:hypothetical protein